MPNIVYVLTNPVMPGLVKIGITDRDDVQLRMRDLYTTGVPLPFECVIAHQLEGINAAELESALHKAFDPDRVNPSREFFQIDPDRVEVLLRVMPGQDVTPRVSQQIARLQPEDVEAISEYKKVQDRTNEEEFLESLDEYGLRVYERVLAFGKQEDMEIKWTKSGFSLYVVLNQKKVVICYGYPHSLNKYNQSIYTDFASIGTRTNIPPDVIEGHRRDALAISPFETAGGGNDIAYRADRVLEESQVTALIEWLEAVVRSIRDSEAVVPEEDLGTAPTPAL